MATRRRNKGKTTTEVGAPVKSTLTPVSAMMGKQPRRTRKRLKTITPAHPAPYVFKAGDTGYILLNHAPRKCIVHVPAAPLLSANGGDAYSPALVSYHRVRGGAEHFLRVMPDLLFPSEAELCEANSEGVERWILDASRGKIKRIQYMLRSSKASSSEWEGPWRHHFYRDESGELKEERSNHLFLTEEEALEAASKRLTRALQRTQDAIARSRKDLKKELSDEKSIKALIAQCEKQGFKVEGHAASCGCGCNQGCDVC